MKRALALLALSAIAVALVQQRAAIACFAAKEKDDVYLLPPPDQLKAMTLGYRSAAADLLWADVLVTQGFRLQEKRHYDTIVPLVQAVNELDPQFRAPYLYADALITFQAVPSTPEDARAVRKILELGVKNRPLDGELWRNLGTFVCFFAPSSILTDEAEKADWRREGAMYMERAVELAGDDSNIAWQVLGGGNQLMRMGERDAAIRFFRKVMSTTDDEELRQKAKDQLDGLLAEQARSAASDEAALAAQKSSLERQQQAQFDQLYPELRAIRRRRFAGLNLDTMMTMGPPVDPAACAGTAPARAACATNWKDWAMRRLDEAAEP